MSNTTDPSAHIAEQQALIDRLSVELERLGRGIERVAAKHGADHPQIANALHCLLRESDERRP